ncbi:outer membrane beta-barrel protein [Kordia sp. TARA_039_SRF]|nr:outer membrane beta-barrel protein [Kordia sp. TARA_039_SRF]
MKKLLLSIAFVCFCFMQLEAQEKGTFEFGVGGGLNFVSVSDVQSNSTATRTAFNFGVTGEYYFSDRWGIKSRLIYDSKGWADGFVDSLDEFGDIQRVITDFKLNYLTIPVTANWHFGSTRKWYLNFGGYAGFLLNAEVTETGEDVKEVFKSTDFGLTFGIGYKFEVADNVKLYIEYDAQSGLADIFDNNFGDAVLNGRSSFNVGALFRL